MSPTETGSPSHLANVLKMIKSAHKSEFLQPEPHSSTRNLCIRFIRKKQKQNCFLVKMKGCNNYIPTILPS